MLIKLIARTLHYLIAIVIKLFFQEKSVLICFIWLEGHKIDELEGNP